MLGHSQTNQTASRDRTAFMTSSAAPVVFIHGLWLHAASWDPWLQLFTAHGYKPVAPGWPGDSATVAETRANPDAVAGYGIEAVTDHYRRIIDALSEKPILIGHSFGGLIAQKLLGENYGAAAIGIDAAQIKGVLPLPLSALHSTLPVFKNPANKHRAVTLTAEQFRYSFGNAISEEESAELYEKWTIAAPGHPLFEAAAANFSLHSAAQDHTVPEAITKSTLKQYKHSPAVTDLIEFADRGHSLTIDRGWEDVAGACLTWLDKQGL